MIGLLSGTLVAITPERALVDVGGVGYQVHCSSRTLQALPRPVNVLSTHSAWLFSSLVMGCNGLLSGSGSVIAELHARLYRAKAAGGNRVIA